MTNSPEHRGSQGMIPGDEQMDQLLRRFLPDDIPVIAGIRSPLQNRSQLR